MLQENRLKSYQLSALIEEETKTWKGGSRKKNKTLDATQTPAKYLYPVMAGFDADSFHGTLQFRILH